MAEKVVLIVHGGGPVTERGCLPRPEARSREALEAALRGGHDVLRREGARPSTRPKP